MKIKMACTIQAILIFRKRWINLFYSGSEILLIISYSFFVANNFSGKDSLALFRLYGY